MEEVKDDDDNVKDKIINLADGTDKDDAVNLAQLKSYTDPHHNNYHLQESFRFYKNYGDQAQLTVHGIKIPNHDHHDLFVAKKKGQVPVLAVDGRGLVSV